VSMTGNAREPRADGKYRVSLVSQVWSEPGRTAAAVAAWVAAAAAEGADLVALPQECIQTAGEPIPGPASQALADLARRHQVWLIGNLRERAGGRNYLTSLLFDRAGRLAGRYRKSHKLPDEDIDLGDELPVFETELGRVALRIGTDRHFPDIDHVYALQGADFIFWAQAPEPIEDEYLQDAPAIGRALDYRVMIACARYAGSTPYFLPGNFPPYRGCPVGRSWLIDRDGQRLACTARIGGGVATATVEPRRAPEFRCRPDSNPAFALLTQPVQPPPARNYPRRRIRLTLVEGDLGIDEIDERLDQAGRLGSDLVGLYEFEWITAHGPRPASEVLERQTADAAERLRRIAARARDHAMYVVVAGVIRRRERNEALIFDRSGELLGVYTKIRTTYAEQVIGQETPVFETDFGRIAVRICADEGCPELERCYSLLGADIVLSPSQSWSPDPVTRDQRDCARAMDGGFFLLETTHPSSAARHRSRIIDPCGVVIARSAHHRAGLVTAEVDLDRDRPLRAIRKWRPAPPIPFEDHPSWPTVSYPDELPETANDLQETIRRQRRPELYGALKQVAAAVQ